MLSDEREQIRCFLSGILHPTAGTRARRRYYLIVTLVLGLAGFSFAHLALAAFGIGRSCGCSLLCLPEAWSWRQGSWSGKLARS